MSKKKDSNNNFFKVLPVCLRNTNSLTDSNATYEIQWEIKKSCFPPTYAKIFHNTKLVLMWFTVIDRARSISIKHAYRISVVRLALPDVPILAGCSDF